MIQVGPHSVRDSPCIVQQPHLRSIPRFPLLLRCLPAFKDYVWFPLAAVLSLATIFCVRLGDGVQRVKAGERLEHTDMGFAPREQDESTPAHPQHLAPGKEWMTVQLEIYSSVDDGEHIVENRIVYEGHNSEDTVLVFREGVALPTRELLSVVNSAYAVLVLRGAKDYFYLSDDFVLSADEELAVVEWGVGRPMFANSLLAVGGTILVAFVEKVWGPAVVGTLLVALSGYRVRGVMTKALRTRSAEWKSTHKLVPRGTHGAERVAQGVLVTLVALADLLDDRWMLLAALILASAQVVVLEYVGQALLTWGRERYCRVLRLHLKMFAYTCAVLAAWLWMLYAFAGFFGCFFVGLVLMVGFVAVYACSGANTWEQSSVRYLFYRMLTHCVVVSGGLIAGIWLAVIGWDDADLKFSWKSLQPWGWPLLRAPDSLSTAFRIVGLWWGVGGGCFIAVYAVVGMFSCTIGSQREKVGGVGERTLARKSPGSRGFRHYDERPIPSRHLLAPDGRKARGVGQQTAEPVDQQPAPSHAFVV